VTALAGLALALAALCVPGPPAAARVRAMGPSAQRRTIRFRLLPGGAVGIAALAGLALAGPGGALAAGVACTVERRRRRRRRSEVAAAGAARELADAVRRMTDEMRAGAHPAAALAGIPADGPLAQAVLGPAAAAARLGDGVATALAEEAGRRPEQAADIVRLARAWTLAERHGVPLADLLAGVHADIRWRLAHAERVRAQLAGPRATAGVLTALPLLGLGFGQLLGADPVGVLRDGLLGQMLLVTGVGLTAAGMAWADRIVRVPVLR
jgi:tight adherence protein B